MKMRWRSEQTKLAVNVNKTLLWEFQNFRAVLVS